MPEKNASSGEASASPPEPASKAAGPKLTPADEPKPRSRRTFVKAALVGAAAAAGVGAGWTFLSPILRPSLIPQTPYGSYVIWFDTQANLFKRRNVATSTDEAASPDGARIVQDAIAALQAPGGGEIWLSSNVNLPTATVTIDRDNISLIALRDPPPRIWDNPRPHVQTIEYTGNVNGGLVQGIHCHELRFDGTGNQQMIVLRDIGMHPTGTSGQQGLRFLGGTGFIQYIEIENLKVALSGTDPTAIEFANSNPGSGHFAFTGITSIETEYDAGGQPSAVRVSSGAQTGTPIRFDNLTIVDLPVRTAGSGIRPIWVQAQDAVDKGLRQMHIGRLFFEQHFAPQHTIVTIEPAVGTGAYWFGLTIDELSISDEQGKTVYLIDNRNTSWMAREQYLHVKSGVKSGVGTVSLGTLGLHQYFRVYLGDMTGVTPFGQVATPFTDSVPVSFVGPGGTGAAPAVGGEYLVAVRPLVITSSAPWNLKDPGGVAIEAVPAGESRTVPLGYRVQFPSGTPSVFA